LQWEGYDAIAQTRDTQAYLRAHAKSEKPFLFMLSWGPPHSPYGSAPEKYRALYDAEKVTLRGNVPPENADKTRRNLAGYYAHCTALDDCVRDLLQTLDEAGLAQNTVVIFTADHGDMLGSHGMAAKQKPWDESIRIPLLVRWPKKLKPAGELDAVFTSEDFMPTILGLCNVAAPKTIEGIDYSGYLRGGKNPSDGTALIANVSPFGEWTRREGGREFRGIRTPRYTYVRDHTGPWLLFDNQSDPLQMTNLVNEAVHAKLQADLDKKLQRKLKASDDDFLPGEAYLKKWGYQTDANGTVPYKN
jgi:arylsulfatase A-like enzyme